MLLRKSTATAIIISLTSTLFDLLYVVQRLPSNLLTPPFVPIHTPPAPSAAIAFTQGLARPSTVEYSRHWSPSQRNTSFTVPNHLASDASTVIQVIRRCISSGSRYVVHRRPS